MANTLNYHRGKRNSSRVISLDLSHRKFTGLPTEDGRPWDLSLNTFLHSYDPQTARVFYNRVVSILDAGIKHTLLIDTDSHGRIMLTLDHPVLCRDGKFCSAAKLQVGDRLIVKGRMLPTGSGGKKPRNPERRVIDGLKHHPNAWRQTVGGYEYQRTHYARLVVEANMNGISIEELIVILKGFRGYASSLKYLPPDKDVHHIDGDCTNDAFDNLAVIDHAEHPLEHDPVKQFNVSYTELATIENVQPGLTTRTYDIQMVQPGNNFAVNNGIIVRGAP